MPKSHTKRVRAFACVNKNDGTLFRFAMPVEDIEDFYEITARTKSLKAHKKFPIEVVPCTIFYTLPTKPNSKRR